MAKPINGAQKKGYTYYAAGVEFANGTFGLPGWYMLDPTTKRFLAYAGNGDSPSSIQNPDDEEANREVQLQKQQPASKADPTTVKEFYEKATGQEWPPMEKAELGIDPQRDETEVRLWADRFNDYLAAPAKAAKAEIELDAAIFALEQAKQKAEEARIKGDAEGYANLLRASARIQAKYEGPEGVRPGGDGYDYQWTEDIGWVAVGKTAVPNAPDEEVTLPSGRLAIKHGDGTYSAVEYPREPEKPEQDLSENIIPVPGQPGFYVTRNAQGQQSAPFRMDQPKPSLDDLIVEALVAGDEDAAFQLDDFARRPSQIERLNAALQVAQSPADYLTVVGMLRGELPSQQQGGTLGRIAPEAQTNQGVLGMLGGQQQGQGLGEAAQNFLGARGQQGQSVQGTFQQTASSLLTGFAGTPAQQLEGFAQTLRNRAQAGEPFSTLQPLYQQALAETNAKTAAQGADTFAAETWLPQSGMMPIGTNQNRYYNAETNQYMVVDKNDPNLWKVSQAPGIQSKWVLHQEGGAEPAGLSAAPTNFIGATSTQQLGATTAPTASFVNKTTGATGTASVISPQGNGFSVAPQTTGGYPSFIQQALGQNLLNYGAETPRANYQNFVGIPPNRSLQTVRMQTPTERSFSETIPTLFGIPKEDFLQQEQLATSIGGPRKQRARFIGATL